MLYIGVDAHKGLHAAVAITEAGQIAGEYSGPNTTVEWRRVLAWGQEAGSPRVWGIEGAWSYGRGLAQYLVGKGEVVHEVNSRWTAQMRRSARRRGKSDRLDALAVARFMRQESSQLPVIVEEDVTSTLGLLTVQRERILAEATRIRNQLHQHLLQLAPDYHVTVPNLTAHKWLRVLESLSFEVSTNTAAARLRCVRLLCRRLRSAMEDAEHLSAEIESLVIPRFLGLTRVCGINVLSAGALAGILGPGDRFSSDAQLAAYAGVAPLEASSAGGSRHRLNRGGNRRLNAIVYRVALTQLRHLPEAQAYMEKRLAEGKTKKEVIRSLKRYIIRAIWQAWRSCLDSTELSAAAS